VKTDHKIAPKLSHPVRSRRFRLTATLSSDGIGPVGTPAVLRRGPNRCSRAFLIMLNSTRSCKERPYTLPPDPCSQPAAWG